MLIQCTKKLLSELGRKPEEIEKRDEAEQENPFFNWHANILKINRKKAVVLMNDINRYAIVLYGLKAKDFKQFDDVVKEAIRKIFLEEGIKEDVIDQYLNFSGDLTYGKTRDRSFVARMNKACDMAQVFADLLVDDSIYQTDVSKVVSSTIVGDRSGDYFYPHRTMYQNLEEFYGSSVFSTRAAVVKVTLDLEGRSVWRRLVVPLNLTFYKFHKVLQTAFWWQDSHLHEFYIYNGDRHVVNLVCDNEAFNYPKDDWKMVHEEGIRLSDYLLNYRHIKYDYDFGDNWEHYIEVEEIIEDYQDNSPKCLDGEGNAPPEDVGGEDGFEDFLGIINNPDDPEYEDVIRWGSMQGYCKFDIERINSVMRFVSR